MNPDGNPKAKEGPTNRRALANAMHADVLRMYLELGPQRKFTQLHQLVTEKYGSVTLRTLQLWSRKEDWPRRAKDYDAMTQAQLAMEKGEITDLDQFPVESSLMLIAKKLLHQALKYADMIPLSPGQLETMVRTAQRAIQLREFLLDPAKQSSGSATANANTQINVNIGVGDALQELERQRRELALPAIPEMKTIDIDTEHEEPERSEVVPENAGTTFAEALKRKSSPP